MSRIGNNPIVVPDGTTVMLDGHTVTVSGIMGTLTQTFNPDITITQEDRQVRLARSTDERSLRSFHGLTRALLYNMVTGVTEGYRKTLEIIGAGYRATQSEERVTLQVGYSHTVEIIPLPGITLAVEGPTRINVNGIDKQTVGEMAAQIRRVRRPNPYTGKGIRYQGERIKLKPGKAAGRKT
jgi:large subunit ribosomal protein L6